MPREICREPGRRLLYEHLLSHFLAEEDLPAPRQARCKICSAQVACVAVARDGTGTCLAQHAIVSKRPVKLAEGVPARHDSPTVKGKNAFNDKGFMFLASAERGFLNTNIAPVGPLPDNIVAERRGGRSQRAFYRSLLDDPPAPPFVAGILRGQNAQVPIVPSTSREIVIVNGGQVPERFDRRQLRRSLEAATALGRDGFEVAVSLRAALAAGERDRPFRVTLGGRATSMEAGEAMAWLKRLGLRDLRETMRSLPAPGDREIGLLREMMDEAA